MENNKGLIILFGIAAVAGLIWFFGFRTRVATAPLVTVTSFQSCVAAGLPVTGSNPRQCKTTDGRTYAEEIAPQITYTHSSADMVIVDSPFPGAVTGKDFSVTGKARGTWFFEASFPVKVLDKDGNVLASGPAQASGDWMTTEFVPFSIHLTIPQSYIGPATLVIMKDNPSGMPANDASLSFPFTIEY